MHADKFIVWAAILSTGIIGLYCIEDSDGVTLFHMYVSILVNLIYIDCISWQFVLIKDELVNYIIILSC